MESNLSILPLYGIPLCQAEIEDIKQEDIDFIKNVEYTRYPADNGYGTPNKFLLDSPELSDLKSKIMNHVHEFLYGALDVHKSVNFEMTNSWANKHIKGDESGAHTHYNSSISGVFYAQTDENSGAILFHKAKTWYNIFHPTIGVPYNGKNLNIFNSEGWAIKPKTGSLILFPSTLEHSVLKNESDIDRYSVAFNIFPFGKFGYDDVVQLGLTNSTQE
jgi:uncharacterized protein (TIGR02466 family)